MALAGIAVADTIVLTMPPTANNGGHGSVSNPVSTFAGYETGGYYFNNGGSFSAAVTGDVSLTLAVVKSTVATWSVVQSAEGSLTIGSGSSVELELTNSINWSDSYKVIAVVDNLDNALNGGNGDAYTMTGISVTAEDSYNGVGPSAECARCRYSL